MSAATQGYGRWEEWRNEIIRLSVQYGLVTPFTTYQTTSNLVIVR
jgi:hypothetical protein